MKKRIQFIGCLFVFSCVFVGGSAFAAEISDTLSPDDRAVVRVCQCLEQGKDANCNPLPQIPASTNDSGSGIDHEG